jgi:RNA polymerase-binding transcription factor DksA
MDARNQKLRELALANCCSKDFCDASDKLRLLAQQQSDIQRIEKRIIDIKKALGCIDGGSYGTCIVCGDEIDLARLNAIPEAVECIRCLAKKEKL